jgi:hypothetical protein
MFNEYGVPNQDLHNHCISLEQMFEKFLVENKVDNPIEIMAVANYVQSSLQIVVSERILRLAMKKRKEERNK